MTTIDKFIGTEFRSRYVNPTWIEGMKKEGYAGAGAMREFVEYLWGWDATAPEVIDDAKWKETFDVYVEDKHKLGMQEFFEKNSPFAYQDMTGRMVETVRKGYWKADAATQKKLLEEYVNSVDAAWRQRLRGHDRQPAACRSTCSTKAARSASRFRPSSVPEGDGRGHRPARSNAAAEEDRRTSRRRTMREMAGEPGEDAGHEPRREYHQGLRHGTARQEPAAEQSTVATPCARRSRRCSWAPPSSRC